MNALEKSGAKLDFVVSSQVNLRNHELTQQQNIAYPPGRTASGFTQKFTALKKSLKPEIDAINSGSPLPDAATTPGKKAGGGRKRKAKDEDENETPTKKRGRPKKNATAEPESEAVIKDEPEGEVEVEDQI